MALEHKGLEGLSPLADLSLASNTPQLPTPKERAVERRLTWSSDSLTTPRRKGSAVSSGRFRLQMTDRSSLLCRMNSEPCGSALTPKMETSSINDNISILKLSSTSITQLSTRSPSPRVGKENSYVQSQRKAIVTEATGCSQTSSCVSEDGFRFPTPTHPASSSTRLVNNDSPVRNLFSMPSSSSSSLNFQSPVSTRSLTRRSFSSEWLDDVFTDMEKSPDTTVEGNSMVLGNLLTGTLLGGASTTGPSASESVAESPNVTAHPQILRRAFSLAESTSKSTGDECNILLSFKRPREVAAAAASAAAKRRKSSLQSLENIIVDPDEDSTTKKTKDRANARPRLQRSATESSVGLYNSVGHTELIGDFTVPYALPTMPGRHEDLKSISCETLASLLFGKFDSSIASYKIIDCRYPYEYEGGHIKGSLNLFTFEQIEGFLEENSGEENAATARKRNILIFHCEFSVERGPTLYRHLRRCDRRKWAYPSLQYPEIYLLHGGYESFFSSHKPLCEPSGYKPMSDPNHEKDLRKFRSKSNTLSGSRSTYKRLGML